MNSNERYDELRRLLDAGALIKTAQAQDGFTDFGDETFLEPMQKLIDCIARDVDFNDQGIDILKRDLVRHLVNRLRFQHDLEQHPEILDEDVSDPIIIMGLGRSGTTKLQRVLSAPDDVQKMYFWRIWNPGRVPGYDAGHNAADAHRPDPRIAGAGQAHVLTDDKPKLATAHNIEQGEVDEDWIMLMTTFDDWGWTNMVPIPSYFDWVMTRSAIEPYRYLKAQVQYLQWQDGGRGGKPGGRPWIMKGIGYIAHLDAILASFPKATIVHPHRDPRQTIPSYASFEANIWPIQSKPLDPKFIGRETQRMWQLAMARYLEARDRLKLDGRILDVRYEDVRSDPISVARAVYAHAGRPLSAAAEQKMAAWHSSNEQGRFGKHEYSLEEFGISNASIDEAFGEYIRRFITR